MSVLRTMLAGFSSQFQELRANWKQVLAMTFFLLVVCPIVGNIGGIFLAQGLIWLVVHMPKGVNHILQLHPLAFMLGFVVAMLIFVFCSSAYKEGKKKKNNNDDKVSSI